MGMLEKNIYLLYKDVDVRKKIFIYCTKMWMLEKNIYLLYKDVDVKKIMYSRQCFL